MKVKDFLNLDNYKDKYIFVGNNRVADILLKRYLGEYRIENTLPEGGLLLDNVVVRNDDILSKDFKELKRPYKFVIQVDKVDGRRKIFKSAKKEEIIDTTPEENKEFIINEIRKKLEVNKKQAHRILKYNQYDVNSVFNQIQQLKYLSEEEIEKYIKELAIKRDDDIFEFINTLLEGKNYMEYLNKLNEHPLKLIYMIKQQVRGLIICKDLTDYRNNDIAKHFSLHPYQVQLFKKSAKKLEGKRLINIYKLCSQKQREIKTGKIQPDTALDYICLYIAGGD